MVQRLLTVPTHVAEALATRSASNVVDAILSEILPVQASDIHFEPHSSSTRVRVRIGGNLSIGYPLPAEHHHAYIARLKALAGIRLDERFTAHDGRFYINEHTEARLSVVPTRYGEKAVIRLLVNTTSNSLSELGMNTLDVQLLEQVLTTKNGLVLIVGPTGSGKTTTLYTLLRFLSRSPQSIVTIEDPVEYAIENVVQLPVTTTFTCASALRAVLRQDPDVIAVGEIRDGDTGRLAVEAALTGHLVIATVHARSVKSAIDRIETLGVPARLVQESLLAVVAQKLVTLDQRGANRCGEFSVQLYENDA